MWSVLGTALCELGDVLSALAARMPYKGQLNSGGPDELFRSATSSPNSLPPGSVRQGHRAADAPLTVDSSSSGSD